MSWKFAWLGMPMGGAKAGLIEAPEWTTDTRREAIRAFGRALGPQLRSRMYGAGTDMGFGPEDLWEFQVGAGRVSGPPPPPSQRGDTGEATALTVFACVREALRARRGDVTGATAAIEGIGAVGAALAGMLAEAGVRVTSVSNRFTAVHDEAGLDIPTIRKLRAERGDEGLESYESGTRIEHAELLEMPVDVLIPCAAHWSLNPENADRLQCGSVVSAANCPISPDLGESGLERRGILVVPDFVANSGGILYANIPASDAGRREILRTLYPAAVARLFQVADQTGGSVTDLARAAAVRRTRAIQNDVERARREMEELDRAFARRRSRIGRRLRGESEGRALARRWLDPGRLA
jgi:glutamate dehydrogenase (NAD(P)+)